MKEIKTRHHLTLSDSNLNKAILKATEESILPLTTLSKVVDYIIAKYAKSK